MHSFVVVGFLWALSLAHARRAGGQAGGQAGGRAGRTTGRVGCLAVRSVRSAAGELAVSQSVSQSVTQSLSQSASQSQTLGPGGTVYYGILSTEYWKLYFLYKVHGT